MENEQHRCHCKILDLRVVVVVVAISIAHSIALLFPTITRTPLSICTGK